MYVGTCLDHETSGPFYYLVDSSLAGSLIILYVGEVALHVLGGSRSLSRLCDCLGDMVQGHLEQNKILNRKRLG